MKDSRLITNNLISTNVSIIFYIEDEFGKISKFTKTLSNIKETASYENIYAAASAVAKLYDYDKYDVKLITTNLIQDDVFQTLEEPMVEETPEEETSEDLYTENVE